MLLFCIFGGIGISWHLILFPVFAIVQYFITMGLVLGLSAINVYIKDTEYIVQFFINMLFYGTPILYDLNTFKNFPAVLMKIINLNPFKHLMVIYRDLFMYHHIPDTGAMLYVIGFAIVCFLGGLAIFRKLEKGFAEEV